MTQPTEVTSADIAEELAFARSVDGVEQNFSEEVLRSNRRALVRAIEHLQEREDALNEHVVIEAMRNFVANPKRPMLTLIPRYVEEFLAILGGKSVGDE